MADQQKPSEPAARCPRWMRWVLVVSLALNLLIVGLVAGVALGGAKHAGHHPSRLDQIGGPLTRALSKQDRRAIGREMRAAYRDRSGDRAEQRAQMLALIEELRQEPFDTEAAAAHMAAQRELLQDRVALGQSILIERWADMSSSERNEYADSLQTVLERRRRD